MNVTIRLQTEYNKVTEDTDAMKLLMINKYLYPKGGAETYMLKLGAELKRMGHIVEYFGMSDERNCVSNSAGEYTSNIDFHKRSPEMLTYPFKIIYSHEAEKRLGRLLQSFKPDAAHLHNINYQLTPSVIYELKRHNIPMVVTAHDVQWVCPNHMMTNIRTMKPCDKCLGGNFMHCTANRCIHNSALRSLLGTIESGAYRLRHTYRHVNKIICPSRFMEKQLEHNPDIRGRTQVMYNFTQATASEMRGKQDYVLFFGRFSPEKGIGTLLCAARSLPDIKFVFAGRGELEQEIESVENAVNVGFKTGEELNRLISQARFSVLPSEWAENCPFSVMESQSLMTPVIGSDMGGIPELITDGVNGLIFRSKDAEALTRKIRLLYDDRKLSDTLSENCRLLHYDNLKEYAEKMLKIYNELAEDGAAEKC